MKNPPRRAAPSPPARPWNASLLIVVAAATLVAFLPAFDAGYVNFDDDRVIVRNPHLRQPLADAWTWMWTRTYVGHYQPITWLSLWIDARLGALRPFAFHATNVALHVAAAVLLAMTLVRLLRAAPATRDAAAPTVWLAASAAALFWSIHPLRVESVAWISERRDPLSIVFWLLALYAYVRHAAESRDRRWYVVSIAALAGSLLAKAWGMSFVIVLIVIDWAVLDRRAWLEKTPYAIAGAAAAVAAWLAQRSAVDTMVPLSQWGWSDRLFQACYGVCFYVWKTVLPTGLAALYELPRSWHDMATPFIMSAAAVVAGAIAFAVYARRHRAIAGAAVVYVVTLAPVLGFAQSGPQLVADRYAYVSGLVLAALVAAALVILARRTGARPLVAACGAVLVAYGVQTSRQASVWHDSITLWTHAIATGHESYRAHFNLGQALRVDGKLDEAMAEYRLALAMRPESGNAWYVYGNAMKARGRQDEAEQAYKRATASANPESTEWLLAHVNLGNLYFNAKRLDEAIAEYRAAVAQMATHPPAEVAPEPYLYLGMALGDKGDLAGAREALDVARRHPATRARAEQELIRVTSAEHEQGDKRSHRSPGGGERAHGHPNAGAALGTPPAGAQSRQPPDPATASSRSG